MSSSVHFKFKSQKEPSKVTFDGTAISVFELKKEIIKFYNLGDGTDFELAIDNESNNEEYVDDTTLIPRSTSVIARRLPAIRPGRGGAARYVSGKAPVKARNTTENDVTKPSATISHSRGPDMSTAQTEAERVQAMFNLEGEQWKRQQQKMATEQRVSYGAPVPQKSINVPEGKPPRGYVCYRCGNKGHWIQACPTNDDPNFEGKARIKRTTGIPRSMLKTIDKSELKDLDEVTRQQMMINGDGEYVIPQTDEKEWQKHQEKVKASAAAQERANSKGDQDLQSRGLECPVDKVLFVDPVKTPCCQRTYCNECISSALIDSDLTCPSCSTENVTLEELVPDTAAELKVDAYKAEKAAGGKRDDDSKSPASGPSVEAATPIKSPSSSHPGSQSPSAGSTDGRVVSKKRGADEISDAKTGATAASEMKRQRSGEGTISSKPSPQKPVVNTPTLPETPLTPAFAFPQMVPPDVSQMMQNLNGPNMNFSLPMPGMPFMPGMNMNMMNPGMMSMTGNFMAPNFSMAPMNGGVGGMNFMKGMNFAPTSPNGDLHHPNNAHTMYGPNLGHPKPYPGHHPPSHSVPPGVPTGPRNHTIPTGPPIPSKFSNQQRHLGKEEDNAYMRQPVNPHRHQNRQRRARPSDYRELGA